ncbi:helix-turn-helix transcriptional regulator [Bacteroides sp.]|uniref:helix-turn-helix domain-containing protein n=1 Tax=Bacteroides sp. TaxID=29523 RepID=UPI002FC8BCE1
MELKVKELIKAKGLTMQQVADLLGVTRDTLTRNINGNPTVETLSKIADALGVEITDLFEKSSDEIVGAVRIGGDTHVINSKEDIKRLAENL